VLLPSVFRQAIFPVLLLVASCAPKPEQPPTARLIAEKAVAATPAPAKPATAKPQGPAATPRASSTTLSGIPITAVTFDSRSHQLVVADQPGGPGSQWPDAHAAAASRNGLAAVNGGFFTPEGGPLGLVIAGGKRAGSMNRASSLGAGLFVDDGSPALVRRESGGTGGELLQSGPFLLENGRAIAGLSPESSTARTFLGWDGACGWFIARSGPCSLADLAKALDGAEIGGISCHVVLNLDGGRSSDLWAGSSLVGGPISQRPFWNKPVRNFLVLLPR
jgi:uncharacterized protein YigE (DUF2233 family)